jgi:starch-binding outer membrane protein, SusD/RagB family
MKKSLVFIGLGITLAISSCSKDYLDLDPLDNLTEASYFTTPDQFKASVNNFYDKMISWKSVDGSSVFDFMDNGSDLSSNVTVNTEGGYANYGRGTVNAPTDDKYWNNPYKYIRNINILLAKADAYTGAKSDIKQYVGEAKFFRAWQYFFLLQRFGGVPIVTTVLDLNAPQLYGARNSRYEVINQISVDLTDAIANLPTEQLIPSADKGHISKWAAEAFKARVLLYEATWRKYTGVTTDFEGSAGPATDQIAQFLTDAVSLAKDVMDNGGYSLWNYNSTLGNASYYYLFNIDGSGSNPLGLDKSSNNEFILKSLYDYGLRQGTINLTHTVQSYLVPNRKMMDMFLCTDGLPVDKSPLFQGYTNVTSEYKNRDFRMLGYLGSPSVGSISLTTSSYYGFSNRKFAAYNYPTYRADNQESQDYPQIRLAEVYLIYAEALMEKNGSIDDADLNLSINKIRTRTGVAPLTNSLATANGLDMLSEIRRERALELFGENNRFGDLKRWGIAEQALNQPIIGMVVGDASYPTEFRDATGTPTSKYNPNVYVNGELSVPTGKGNLKSIVIDAAANRNFKRMHYLFPLPLTQIKLNPKLVQNNDY